MMEVDKICVKSVNCPIYKGVLESNKFLIDTFKSLYCENGKEGREDCKRYQVSMIAGTCPPDILPNSDLSIESILRLMDVSK